MTDLFRFEDAPGSLMLKEHKPGKDGKDKIKLIIDLPSEHKLADVENKNIAKGKGLKELRNKIDGLHTIGIEQPEWSLSIKPKDIVLDKNRLIIEGSTLAKPKHNANKWNRANHEGLEFSEKHLTSDHWNDITNISGPFEKITLDFLGHKNSRKHFKHLSLNQLHEKIELDPPGRLSRSKTKFRQSEPSDFFPAKGTTKARAYDEDYVTNAYGNYGYVDGYKSGQFGDQVLTSSSYDNPMSIFQRVDGAARDLQNLVKNGLNTDTDVKLFMQAIMLISDTWGSNIIDNHTQLTSYSTKLPKFTLAEKEFKLGDEEQKLKAEFNLHSSFGFIIKTPRSVWSALDDDSYSLAAGASFRPEAELTLEFGDGDGEFELASENLGSFDANYPTSVPGVNVNFEGGVDVSLDGKIELKENSDVDELMLGAFVEGGFTTGVNTGQSFEWGASYGAKAEGFDEVIGGSLGFSLTPYVKGGIGIGVPDFITRASGDWIDGDLITFDVSIESPISFDLEFQDILDNSLPWTISNETNLVVEGKLLPGKDWEYSLVRQEVSLIEEQDLMEGDFL